MTKREKSQIRTFRVLVLQYIAARNPRPADVLNHFADYSFRPEPGVGRTISTSWALQNALNSFKRNGYTFRVDERLVLTERGRAAEVKLQNGEV